MYRTDKQFMKNPATAAMRIYIGNLAKTVIANDLEQKFKQHGNIIGLSLNAGFAFIQFDTESEAQSAITVENGTMLCGRKIIVKQALDKSKSNMNQGGQQRGAPGPIPQRPPLQEPLIKPINNNLQPAPTPPPPPAQNVPPKPQFIENKPDFTEDIIEDDRPNVRPPVVPPRHIIDDMHKGGRGRKNERDFDRYSNRFEPPPKMDMYRENRDFFRGMPGNNYPPPPRNEVYQPPLLDIPPTQPDKNDCEIIVVAKQLTEYAEFIEQKLKNHGLLVDLLFPNEDVPIGKVLANISSRGCLYAILVMPVNEENRSLTLNILHGIPQEHRNMPVEDAIILISRDFEAYMKGEPMQSDPSQMTLLDRHPNPIQMLLNMLAENRQISSSQYDKLIGYLQERKALQHEYEVEEGLAPKEESDAKQVELQSRIMSILNKSNESSIPASITAPDPPSSEPTPILKDPTVQKALDSLMLGEMFKNMAG
ncbi:unnamed protein product [Phyllotreta striolata]|uniref:RRM domain-containing protein n=1 Tax=Phyllotreta striolata TaxID=444603 RepID=A0A9N9XJU4_PHYSR|nr:unnamed protein product [Phyllotreta striolata]